MMTLSARSLLGKPRVSRPTQSEDGANRTEVTAADRSRLSLFGLEHLEKDVCERMLEKTLLRHSHRFAHED